MDTPRPSPRTNWTRLVPPSVLSLVPAPLGDSAPCEGKGSPSFKTSSAPAARSQSSGRPIYSPIQTPAARPARLGGGLNRFTIKWVCIRPRPRNLAAPQALGRGQVRLFLRGAGGDLVRVQHAPVQAWVSVRAAAGPAGPAAIDALAPGGAMGAEGERKVGRPRRSKGRDVSS